ncbi:MAG TPA: hypothetical protein PLO37_00500 [Candidatus Hydrogenedentes bacterium]|nr:hypothetical protein [Candidatus Hydrogenedentota bacterium]HPG65293.1 hypothetical protein [Candidatus Hydrogenedentota bacterium]
MSRRLGYILIESALAMALLSICMLAIQGAIRQTLFVRGQARDYTQVKFLLESIIGEIELQPEYIAMSKTVALPGEFSRFTASWDITRIDLPTPPLPRDVEEDEIKRLSVPYLAKVKATVKWQRSGQHFEESAETILAPERIYVTKEELEEIYERSLLGLF